MNHQSSRIRVGLVDDHPVVREGLRAFLQLAGDIEVVAEASSGAEAIAMVDATPIDVLLMDLVLQGELDGVAVTRQIAHQHPEIQILALTSFQDPERMIHVLEAGAIGYLQKDVSPDHLLGAIRQTASGRTVLESSAWVELRKQAAQGPQPTPRVTPELQQSLVALTKREQEVLQGLADGLSNKEIAVRLNISEKTVKVHVSHILGKLEVYDRMQALLAAAKLGLITLPR